MISRKTYFLVFTISFLILTGCEKKLINYRNKWVGEYQFTFSYTSQTVNGEYYSIENQESTGRIYYTKDGSKNNIVIEVDKLKTYSGEIYKNGELDICGVSGLASDKNNIEFKFSSQQCGGALGFSIVHVVKGVKKE